MNFKIETIEAIEKSGHNLEDVMFIGSYDGQYRMNIDKFLEKSDFNYDDGYGAQEIAEDLIIYFKDKSYITRGEYDGSEWWEFNSILDYKESDEYKDFNNLCVAQVNRIGWCTVGDLNKEEK